MADRLVNLKDQNSISDIKVAVSMLETVACHPFGCFSEDGKVSYSRNLLENLDGEIEGNKAGSLYTRILLEMADSIDTESGYGSSWGLIIACSLLRGCNRLIASGHSAVSLRKELNSIKKKVVSILEDMTIPCEPEHRKMIASELSTDQELNECVLHALEDVGLNGFVLCEPANGFESVYEYQEGSVFDRGFMHRGMCTDDNHKEAVLINPAIVVSERPLGHVYDVVSFTSRAAKENKPLLIIAEHVEDEPLKAMLSNKQNGGFLSVAIQAPKYGTERKVFLNDIASVVGATVINAETGDLKLAIMKDSFLEMGGAKKVEVYKDHTVIHGGYGKKEVVSARLEYVKKLLEEGSDNEQFLRDRLQFLSGKTGKIFVSGLPSEVDARINLTKRIKTAIQGASIKGVISGDAFAYVHAANLLKYYKGQEWSLLEVVEKALKAPACAMFENCGLEPHLFLEKAEKEGVFCGFNFHERRFVNNLVNEGRVSSAEAVINAVEKSFSVAGTLLSAEYAVLCSESR